MIDFLYSLDVVIFFFINHTIANPILDNVFPFLTNLNKIRPIIYAVLVLLVLIVIYGKKTARTTIGLLILTIVISDQLSSSIIKPLVGRLRPCDVLDGVRLLVDCGSGFSFPSSHAVNNFAGASLISFFYRKHRWWWLSFAAIVALTRPYVGVHYPSDIMVGSILGWCIGWCIATLWVIVERKIIRVK